MNVTIVEVFQGSYNRHYAILSSYIVVQPVSNLTVAISFANITFQAGKSYDLGMISARGDTFPISATP